jgi:hypothetical protein
MYVRRIDEYVVPGRRLGRHVRHDPRSLRFLVAARRLGTLRSVRHERRIPVLDQGDLGSCTGNAAEGCVGTGTLFDAIPADLPARPSPTNADSDEEQARALYSAATALDDYEGEWPPEDTGSDGLSVAKACQRAGLISGYRHATSLEAALTALAAQPVIAGINWYSSFDEPIPSGFISITHGAQVRGGHEICLDELNVEDRLIGFTNSWGPFWGAQGRAYVSWDDFGQLLDEDGDVTVFTPATQPAPTPTPADPDAELAGCLTKLLPVAERWLAKWKGRS